MIPLLLAMIPLEGPCCDRVEEIELNHVHDEKGRHILSQHIFWHRIRLDEPPHVVAWRICKPGQPQVVPVEGGYELMFWDGEQLRRIRAGVYRETWRQFDVEIDERVRLPQHKRRGLFTRRTETTPSGIDGGDLAP